MTFLGFVGWSCWWFRNPAVENRLRLVYRLSHYLQGFSTIQTVVVWDFWTINSLFFELVNHCSTCLGRCWRPATTPSWDLFLYLQGLRHQAPSPICNQLEKIALPRPRYHGKIWENMGWIFFECLEKNMGNPFFSLNSLPLRCLLIWKGAHVVAWFEGCFQPQCLPICLLIVAASVAEVMSGTFGHFCLPFWFSVLYSIHPGLGGGVIAVSLAPTLSSSVHFCQSGWFRCWV